LFTGAEKKADPDFSVIVSTSLANFDLLEATMRPLLSLLILLTAVAVSTQARN
jgi:hypothetical protein